LLIAGGQFHPGTPVNLPKKLTHEITHMVQKVTRIETSSKQTKKRQVMLKYMKEEDFCSVFFFRDR